MFGKFVQHFISALLRVINRGNGTIAEAGELTTAFEKTAVILSSPSLGFQETQLAEAEWGLLNTFRTSVLSEARSRGLQMSQKATTDLCAVTLM